MNLMCQESGALCGTMALPRADVQHLECHHHSQWDESSPVPLPACSEEPLLSLLPCYSATNSWSCCFACQCSFPYWDITYPLHFEFKPEVYGHYFIMLETTIYILYLIKFFCHFPYDFCILHVPEHFNSYRTCNIMKEQEKWTQHVFATPKHQCFSATKQTAQ